MGTWINLAERNEDMRSFFAEKASTYDEVHGQPSLMDTKLTIPPVLPEDTKKLLDLGAGTGLELIAVFERFPDVKVTAIDITEEMLAELRKRPFASSVESICGDFFSVDFGNGYDAVISSSALHHFDREEKARLYRKIFDALKPGGLFINADCIASSLEDEEFVFSEYRNNRAAYKHLDTPLYVGTEETLLREAGFTRFESTDLENPKYKRIIAGKE